MGGEETVHAHTMPEAIYSEDAADKFIRSKKGDLAQIMQTRIDHQVGSGWSVKHSGLFHNRILTKNLRGFFLRSHPPELSRPALKLVNVKKNSASNTACFTTTEKTKSCDRLSV